MLADEALRQAVGHGAASRPHVPQQRSLSLAVHIHLPQQPLPQYLNYFRLLTTLQSRYRCLWILVLACLFGV